MILAMSTIRSLIKSKDTVTVTMYRCIRIISGLFILRSFVLLVKVLLINIRFLNK